MTRVLLAGVSTRAAAASAARAGYDVVALDAYADLDQHPAVTARSVGTGSHVSATALVRAAAGEAVDVVSYLSNFENHPRAVAALTRDRELWGNTPDVLRRVRDPQLLARTLGERGFDTPAVARLKPGTTQPLDWMLKPLRSGGGQRVRRWTGGVRLPRGSYLQELIDGVSGSVVFIAAGGRAVPIALSRQISGDETFGAAGYRYCGSILVPASDAAFSGGARFEARVAALCAAAADAFGVVGINGIDFIERGGEPVPIEINPRWCASAELVERAGGPSVFAAHADACRDGRLPRFDLSAARPNLRASGKAVLFARADVEVGDTRPWLSDGDLADVPRPHTRMARGSPICTVFADGGDVDECYARLVKKARAVFMLAER